MPVFDVRTMQDLYSQRAVKTSSLILQIVADMGVMGMILAAVGLYGLVAYRHPHGPGGGPAGGRLDGIWTGAATPRGGWCSWAGGGALPLPGAGGGAAHLFRRCGQI